MSKIGVVAAGTLAGLIAFAALSLIHFGEQFGPFYLSAVSVLLGTFVLTMGWLVAAYSARNLRGQTRQGRYAALLATAITALWLAVVADPIALMALGWTASGLAIAGLVAHSGTPAARSASKRVAGRLLIGDAALWAAVLLMAVDGIGLRSEVAAAGWLVPALLALAGIVRSALVPAWRWLPLTAEAPSPVSALLHAGVVNGMGLLAILLWPVFAAAPGVLLGLVVVGGLTAVAGTAAMRVRPDVKGKLASSTSAQMGYMTLQVGLGLPAFAMLHLIGHGFYKAWLFLRAGGASRRAAAPALSAVKPAALVGLAAVSAAVIALAAATWPSRPVVDLVPLVVAGVASTFALAALVWPDRRTATHSTPRARSWSMLATLAGLFGYVVVLGVWAGVFEEPGVWSGPAAVALVTVVLVAGIVGMIAVARGWLAGIVQPVVIDTAARVRGRVPQVGSNGLDVTVAVDAATRTVGAMWPLHSAVAVNPLSGLQDLAFGDAAEIAGRTWRARSHMTHSQYAQALAAGRFTEADLVAAAQGYSVSAERVADYLQAHVDWRPAGSAILAAEQVLSGLNDEQIAQRLPRPAASPHTLGEQAGMADKVSALANGWTAVANADQPGSGDLWAAFQQGVRDLGLRGLRDAVQGLPADPMVALGRLLGGVVPAGEQVGYLSRLLARDPGWAAHLKQRDPRLLADLLAIRASFDVLACGARGHVAWEPATRGSDRDWALAQIAPVVALLGVTHADEALALAGELDAAARGPSGSGRGSSATATA